MKLTIVQKDICGEKDNLVLLLKVSEVDSWSLATVPHAELYNEHLMQNVICCCQELPELNGQTTQF